MNSGRILIKQEGSEEGGRPWSSKRERSKLPEGLKATEADTSLLLGSLGGGGGGERGRGLKGRHGKKEEGLVGEGRGGGRRKGRGVVAMGGLHFSVRHVMHHSTNVIFGSQSCC